MTLNDKFLGIDFLKQRVGDLKHRVAEAGPVSRRRTHGAKVSGLI